MNTFSPAAASSSSSSSGAQHPDFLVPVVGVMSVAGRLRDMEDIVTVRTNLCSPGINGFRPIHFFAVYDGHGGPHVSAVCRAYMHTLLEDEVMRAMVDTEASAGSSSSTPPPELTAEQLQNEMADAWKRVLKNCFQRMHDIATGPTSRCGSGEDICSCLPDDVVLILTQEYIIVANCGDSRAIRCRSANSPCFRKEKLG